MKKLFNQLLQTLKETKKTLWPFKFYMSLYLLFYMYLCLNYLTPCPKNYFFWNDEYWYNYSPQLYLAGMELVLLIFLLLFFIGTSNVKNHPLFAKMIFLSSLFWTFLFLEWFDVILIHQKMKGRLKSLCSSV